MAIDENKQNGAAELPGWLPVGVKNANPSFVLSTTQEFYYEDRLIPKIESENDVVVRVVATGICGSDVHYWQHGGIGQHVVKDPIVLGHESTGIVAALGAAVEGLLVGDRVALEPGEACKSCEYCRAGRYNLCGKIRFAATPPFDGTLAKYYRLPRECCFKLPASLSLRDGVLIEPLAIAVHACRLAGDLQSKAVVIFGAGPVGQLCCAVAAAFGASQVVAVDLVESRLAFAKAKGASAVYRMSADSAEINALALKEATGLNDGSEVIIDATGHPTCIDCGMNTIKRGGVFVQAGLGRPNIGFPVGLLCDKEAVFRGTFRYGPGDYQLAIALIATKRVDLAGYITHEFAFAEAGDGFRNVVKREGIKTVIYGPEVDEGWAKEVS